MNIGAVLCCTVRVLDQVGSCKYKILALIYQLRNDKTVVMLHRQARSYYECRVSSIEYRARLYSLTQVWDIWYLRNGDIDRMPSLSLHAFIKLRGKPFVRRHTRVLYTRRASVCSFQFYSYRLLVKN